MMNHDLVNNPKHYTSHVSAIECIEVAEHLGFNLGSAFKYVMRRDDKGNALQDLEKALWYVKREFSSFTYEELLAKLRLIPSSVLQKLVTIANCETSKEAKEFYFTMYAFITLRTYLLDLNFAVLKFNPAKLEITVQNLIKTYK